MNFNQIRRIWSFFVEFDELIQKIYNLSMFVSFLGILCSIRRKQEFENMLFMLVHVAFE